MFQYPTNPIGNDDFNQFPRGLNGFVHTLQAVKIEAALATAGHVVLAPGIYELEREIRMRPGSILEGAGTTTVLRCTTAASPAVLIDGVDDCVVRNLRVTRSVVSALNGDAVAIRRARAARVENVTCVDHHEGVHLYDCASPSPLLVVNGTPGATSRAYVVQTVINGVDMEISLPAGVTTGAAALNGTDSVTVDWADPPGLPGDTITYKVYRTLANAEGVGLIATVAAGVQTYTDEGGAATGSVPVGPFYSPLTGVFPAGVEGVTSRSYAVVAVIDGVRWGYSDVCIETLGHADLSGGNHNTVFWTRLFGIYGYCTEEYEVYRTAGTEGVGLIGTVSATNAFDDTGMAATTALPSPPTRTLNGTITMKNVVVTRDTLATSASCRFGVELNSVEHAILEDPDIQLQWLDGIKARHLVYRLTWRGGRSNRNGVSLNDGASGDGADLFSGLFCADIENVETSFNGGNGIVTKTVGMTHTFRVGTPQYGTPRGLRIRSHYAARNIGNGLAIDGVLDSLLVSGEGVDRARVTDMTVSDCVYEANGLYGLDCNGHNVVFSNMIIRSNSLSGVIFDKQANNCRIVNSHILGNSVGSAQDNSGILCDGDIVFSTLTGDLAAGAGSFTIDDATDVPTSGFVGLGRNVAATPYSAVFEVLEYTRVGTTVTLREPGAGGAYAAAVTAFDHNNADGARALEVGFSVGPRNIWIVGCNINGMPHGPLDVFALGGDEDGPTPLHRESIAVADGCDNIYVLDNYCRYSAESNDAPVVVFNDGADTTCQARVVLRHTGATNPTVTTPQNKYYGGVGSTFSSQTRLGGAGVVTFVKEGGTNATASAASRAGWVAK